MMNNAPSLAASAIQSPQKQSTLPPVDDTRGALMDSIRQGTTLKKVDPAALSTGSGSDDGRSNLLKEIRQGIELRPATERELGQRDSANSAVGTDALAVALRRALQERNKALCSSSEEEESSDNDEWDD